MTSGEWLEDPRTASATPSCLGRGQGWRMKFEPLKREEPFLLRVENCDFLCLQLFSPIFDLATVATRLLFVLRRAPENGSKDEVYAGELGRSIGGLG